MSKAGIKGESLTYAEAESILKSGGFSEEAARSATRLLEKIDSARFSGQEMDSKKPRNPSDGNPGTGKEDIAMKGFKHLLLFVLLFLCLARVTGASETARIFLDGIKDYKENRFAEAAAAFSRVADEGIKNGKLFYNLGNAYLKNGDIGNAVLWYDRALKLLPHDPDLKFNYEYAQSLTKDEKADKELPLFRILFFWKYLLSPTRIQWAAIIFNLIFWSLTAARMIRRKNHFQTIGHVILALGLIFTLTAVYNDYEANFIKEAVILPAKVSIRSGLTDDATELFVLHAGAKVKIDKEKDDYIRIAFSEGKIGWIKKSDAGVI